MENVLILFLELRCLLTGDSYVLLKKFGDNLTRHRRRPTPTPSFVQDRGIDQRILKVANKIIQLLTQEVPVTDEDVTVYFSMEEWKYIEGHKDLYKDIIMDNQLGGHNVSTSGRTLSDKIGDSQAVDLDEDNVTQRILHLTEEVIHLLMLEKYLLIWSLGNNTTPSCSDLLPGSLPLLVLERNKVVEILDLINKVIQLLTGEVPLRCNDVKICLSKEEWEYVKAHKDWYKDVMVDNEFVDSYDAISSTKYIREKPQKCQENFSESLLKNNGPQQPADTFPQTKSGEYFKEPLNFTKHKKFKKQQTSVPCSECGKPCEESNILDVTDQTGVSGPTSEASYKFCGACLLEQSSCADKEGVNTKRKRFRCVECGSCFSNKYSLKNHLRLHTLEKVITCPECGKLLTDAYQLKNHMKVHTGEKSHKCSECGKSFCNIGNLQAHYRVHTGERPFRCSECDKTFRYKSHLVAHQRFHTGQTLVCSECGKHFVYHSRLVRHLRIHTGEKPYKCPECGKGFDRSFYLDQHVLIHTGEFPHKCDQCDKCFRASYELHRHQRTHNSEKPFSCSECDKGFTCSSSLAEHVMIHTGEKPYSCPQCGKLFVKNKYMLKHLKTHNLEKS